MQLGKPTLCAALAAASSTLLGTAFPAQAADWKIDGALMVYEEKDGIKSVSPSLEINRNFADQKKLTITASYDSLSGASPSGASGAAQTVTSPSGKPVQITEGSGLILAPFEDQRQGLAINWEAGLGEKISYSLGAACSSEVDFTALSLNGQLRRSFLKNNLTLAVGSAWESDTLEPVGGTPQAFELNGGPAPKGGKEQRRQLEGLLSASLVLSPTSLAYLAWGLSQSNGYLTDPYKVITVVDPVTGQPIDAVLIDGQLQPNQLKANLYEKRPDSRQRQSLFAEFKQAWGAEVMTVSYRYTHDDWSIRSHTAEGRYHQTLGSRFYLEPNVRWYQQSAAYFYRHSLVYFNDISGPQRNIRYASADRRLAAFDAVSAGVRVGWKPDTRQDLSLRGVVYQQSGDSHPADAIGAQKNINYFLRQTAWWLQLLYSRQW